MNKLLTPELAKQLISEAPSWELGHSTSFFFKDWVLTFCKASDNSYELTKDIAALNATVKYQYPTPEDAFLHLANRFSEKTPARYTSIEDALCSGLRCNTQINYSWYDEEYEEFHEYHYIVNGQFTAEQWGELMKATEDGAFIPEEVGLKTNDGYDWHEIDSIQNATDAPSADAKTPEELIAAFRKARESWRESISGFIPDDERPYIVDIEESLSRSILIWGKDKDDACVKAYDLCKKKAIHLDGNDLNGRTCTCSGIATPKDVERLELYVGMA